MLPDEAEARAKLSELFRKQFAEMDELHDFSVKLIPFPLRIDAQPHLDRSTVDVALALYVKASRQFRGIQLLCEAGLGTDAYALARNLFETTLAVCFVLQPRFIPKRNGRRLTRVKGKPLSSRFRARLYIANLAFEQERMLRHWRTTTGLRRVAARTTDASIRKRVIDAEAVIGPDWTERLKQSHSYSGLSIKDLADSLNLRTSHATFYRSASWSTHATDAEAFFSAELTLDIAPSPRGITGAAGAASVLLLRCIDLLNHRLRRGHDSEVTKFARRIGAV
jgi:uncharacterized protein DUF5677